jgi:thioredoxin-like negative regulator of GroEL
VAVVRDIADAAYRNSVEELVWLADYHVYHAPKQADKTGPVPALVEVATALRQVISRLDRNRLADELPYIIRRMVDAPELAPAAEAAAEVLVAQGRSGVALLRYCAILSSDVMKLRVAAVLERNGYTDLALRLRDRLKDPQASLAADERGY